MKNDWWFQSSKDVTWDHRKGPSLSPSRKSPALRNTEASAASVVPGFNGFWRGSKHGTVAPEWQPKTWTEWTTYCTTCTHSDNPKHFGCRLLWTIMLNHIQWNIEDMHSAFSMKTIFTGLGGFTLAQSGAFINRTQFNLQMSKHDVFTCPFCEQIGFDRWLVSHRSMLRLTFPAVADKSLHSTAWLRCLEYGDSPSSLCSYLPMHSMDVHLCQ